MAGTVQLDVFCRLYCPHMVEKCGSQQRNIQYDVLQVPTLIILVLLVALVSFFKKVLHLLEVKGSVRTQRHDKDECFHIKVYC